MINGIVGSKYQEATRSYEEQNTFRMKWQGHENIANSFKANILS
jgi:hypothetical protein